MGIATLWLLVPRGCWLGTGNGSLMIVQRNSVRDRLENIQKQGLHVALRTAWQDLSCSDWPGVPGVRVPPPSSLLAVMSFTLCDGMQLLCCNVLNLCVTACSDEYSAVPAVHHGHVPPLQQQQQLTTHTQQCNVVFCCCCCSKDGTTFLAACSPSHGGAGGLVFITHCSFVLELLLVEGIRCRL